VPDTALEKSGRQRHHVAPQSARQTFGDDQAAQPFARRNSIQFSPVQPNPEFRFNERCRQFILFFVSVTDIPPPI
jgi:hypothetical protein